MAHHRCCVSHIPGTNIYKIAAGTANTGEVYLMTVLGVGGGFAFLVEMAIMKTAREHRHLWCLPWFHSIPFADILRSLLFFGYMILSQWFWNGGRFTLLLASCNWRVFFFSSTSITGWFAQLSLALSIMAMFVYLLVLALIASSIPARCATINCLLQRVKRLLPSSSESVLTSKRIVMVLGVQLGFYAILIAMIEMFIVWNAISDVSSVASAGQIIPLVTALAGLGMYTQRMVLVPWLSYIDDQGSDHRGRAVLWVGMRRRNGLGFARATIPSTELGMISLNGPQREHIIGRSSQPRLVLYHNGGQSGYLTSFYLFPETNSAIVALGNSYGLGDGPDWTAQALAQAMFDLQPRVDFAEASLAKAKTEYERYDRLATEFTQHRDEERVKSEGSDEAPLRDYVGRYHNTGLKMTLAINKDKDGALKLTFNDVPSQQHKLTHFAGDKLGFLPASREELILREFIDWFQWDQFVLVFHREDKSQKIVAVSWAMQVGIEPLRFNRS
ncbi:hypothetical protein FPSE_04066 [Fusarium pseudograminearum CS3096]|uniref:Peptidase S12 Pab87-related C-terminal domain-containing protein n=1 Tax=Fusarium pseudograminearum (strain CS3096) TaxID=1028729 RepID=K3UTS3_FUSPC|nr:hypothetical protein FPSE_04066 [Fusarium pseudograminearum CS3096]EKJ75886.1 hypothetical protein FPSE_04066 [Fusarium pseudograminearum CS3096]